jgi:Fe-S-cluster containining protein
MHPSASVTLNGDAVPSDHVYFAFASGRLTYDCVRCGAQCCRGHGYELTSAGADLRAQIDSQPLVHLFLDPCEAIDHHHYHVRNCAPGCFFLNEDNRCRLQIDHGYAAKPETCKLFPFNHLVRVEDYLVVAPHSTLCPLGVVGEGAVDDRSRHADLLAALTADGITTHVSAATPLHANVARLVILERAIVTLSERYLSRPRYTAYAAAQLAETRRAFPQANEPGPDTALHDAARFEAALARLLGDAPCSDEPESTTIAGLLAAVTPAIRSQLVFATAPDGKTEPHVDLQRVPHVLQVLYWFARRARDAGMAQITYQTVMRLFGTYRYLLTMLAYADSPVMLSPTATLDVVMRGKPEFQRSYLEIVQQLVPRKQRVAARTLADIVTEHVDLERLDRIAFLKLLARRLSGRVELVQGDAPDRRRRRRAAASVQQWALGHLNGQTIATIGDWGAKR